MQSVWLVAAWTIGLGHFAVIVAVVIGGPLALRWPKLIPLHMVVAVGVGAVFAAGADCPFTTWQKYCLRAAHRVPYEGGFIEHYLVRPITARPMTTIDKATVAAVWLIPTIVSYSLMWRRSGFQRRRLPLS